MSLALVALTLFLLLLLFLAFSLKVTKLAKNCSLLLLGILLATLLTPKTKEASPAEPSTFSPSNPYQVNISALQIENEKNKELLHKAETKLKNLSSEQAKPVEVVKTQNSDLSTKKATPKLSSLFAKIFDPIGSSSPQTFSFKHENFKIELPANATIPMPKSFLPEDACLGKRFRKSKTHFLVIAEEDPGRLFLNDSAFHDLALSNLEAGGSDFRLIETVEVPHPAGVIHSSLCRLKLNRTPISYRSNTLLHQGRAYQILVWSVTSEEKDLAEKVDLVLKGFSILDPNNIIEQPLEPSLALQDIQFSHFGASIKLSQLDATPYTDLKDDFPSASAGYLGNDNNGGVIFLADLTGLNLSDETIIGGCLDIEDISLTHASLKYLGKKEISGNSISQYYFTSRGDEQLWLCRFDIARHESRICIQSVWALTPEKIPSAESFWKHFSWQPQNLTHPLSDELAHNISDNINTIGVHAHQLERFREAERCFQKALELQPNNKTYGANWIRSFTAADRYSSALNAANSVLENNPDHKKAAALKAYILVHLNQNEEAFALYEKLFLSTYNDDDDLLDFLNSLLDEEQYQRGADFMREYVKLKPSSKIQRWFASMLTSNKEYQEAITILTKLIKESPNNQSAIDLLVDAYKKQKKYQQAMHWIKELQKIAPNSIEHQLAEARILRSQEAHNEAYELLATLNKKYPDNSDVLEMFSIASARLGLGDHSSLRTHIPPVQVESALQAQVVKDSAIAHPDETDHPAHYKKSITAYEFKENGSFLTTYYYTVQVTSSSGVEHFKNWKFNFEPNSDDIFVNSHTVYAANGSVAHKGKVSEYFITDDDDDSMETLSKVLTIPNIGIEVGSTIELVLTKRTYYSDKDRFPFNQLYLSTSLPSRISAISVKNETANFYSICHNGVHQSSSQQAHHFWISHPPVYHSEGYMPDSEQILPHVYLGSNKLSWSDVSNKYYQHIAERFASDEQLNEAIEKILSQSLTKEEKLTSCVQWVQGQCNYRAIEFGPRGRMPKPAYKTFKGKEGDCKDMSLLLWHMLRKIGFKAQLALASTDTYIARALPDENQFNHIVLYCPELKANPVLDPTYDFLNLLSTPPNNLAGYYILPVTDQETDLVLIKETEASISEYHIARNITSEQNKLIIEEVLQPKHFAASYLRSQFQGQSERKQKQTLHRWFSDYYPEIVIDSVNFNEGLTNNYKDLSISIRYIYPNANSLDYLPVPWERFYFEWSQANQRINPLWSKVPARISSTNTFHSGSLTATQSSFYESKFTHRQVESDVQSLKYLSLKKSFTAPASAYPTFRTELSQLIPKIRIKQNQASSSTSD
jgi:tetratricopeptide (TPR) repeat protein